MRASNRFLAALAALVLAIAGGSWLALARDPLRPAPELPLELVADWPRLPAGTALGQATGLAVDASGRVFVFHRANREWTEPFPAEPIRGDTVFVFDGPTGRLLGQWGAGRFIMPHGLAIDPEGNVWVTDVGAEQVSKFTPDGALLLTLGERGVGGSDGSHFGQPTDIAFGPDGTVYISDGYTNTRVARFTLDGRYLGSFGRPGKAAGQFDLPHGIAVDRSGRVYVADRSNARLQLFDAKGGFLAQWRSNRVGTPYGVEIAADGGVIVADGGEQPLATRARLIKLDARGRVVGTFETARRGDPKNLGHALAVGPDGAIYIADAWAKRVRKFVSR